MTVVLRFLAALVLTLGFQTHAFVLAATSAEAGPCAIVAVVSSEAEAGKGIASETPSPSCKVVHAEPAAPLRPAADHGAPLRFERPDHAIAGWSPAGLEKPPKSALARA